MFRAIAGHLAPLVTRYRFWVLTLWALILVAGGLSAGHLDRLVAEDVGATGSQSYRANAILKTKFRLNALTEMALVFERPAGADSARCDAYERAVVAAVGSVNVVIGVRAIRLPSTAAGLRMQHLRLRPDITDAGSITAMNAVKQRVGQVPSPGGESAHLIGRPVVMGELGELNKREVSRIERVSIGLSLVILVLVFGSLVAALIPVACGVTAIVVSLGALSGLGGIVPVVEMTRLIASTLAIALGIDYALFMVSRYREERAKGQPIEGAIAQTLEHTGEAIFFSGVIMAVSVAALAIPDFSGSRAVAGAIMVVIAVSLAASFTLLPALLAATDRWLDAPSWLARLRRGVTPAPELAFWGRFARGVVKHHLAVLAGSCLMVALLLAQLGHLRLWEPGPTLLPHELGSRQGYDAMVKAGLGGELDALYLVVHQAPGPHLLAPDTVRAMGALASRLQADSRVRRVDSLVTVRPNWPIDRYVREYARLDNPLARMLAWPSLSLALHRDPGGTDTVMRIVPSTGMTGPGFRELIRDLHSRLLPAVARPAGVSWDLGGGAPRRVDLTEEIYGHMGWMVGFVLVAVYGLLLCYFRSIVLPLKAVLMNAIPVLGGLACLVLVMQDGIGASLFGISEPPGGLMAMTPLMLFCVIFGLSMDYEVLILGRIQEAHRRGAPDGEAIAEGMALTSGVVTGAALIMISVFAPNAFSALINAKELGIGLAAAVFLDATLVRLLLVPATMAALGRWNWYFPGQAATSAGPANPDDRPDAGRPSEAA